MKPAPVMAGDEEFFAHALAIEREAAARYGELAARMLVSNNPLAAELFQRLARMESEHHGRLKARAGPAEEHRLERYRWLDPHSPEWAPFDAAHALMTPHRALSVALANEQRARLFFEEVAGSPYNSEAIRRLAKELAGEERAHAEDIRGMLRELGVHGPDQ